MDGSIFIPRAIAVDSHVIRVFDPVCHAEIDIGDGLDAFGDILQGGPKYDRRFVLCERPAIIAGGELSMAMLDLCLIPVAGYYEAPLQLKANGGIFVIDDLGRHEIIRPFDLFNRWIMPIREREGLPHPPDGKEVRDPFDQSSSSRRTSTPELANEASSGASYRSGSDTSPPHTWRSAARSAPASGSSSGRCDPVLVEVDTTADVPCPRATRTTS